MFKHIKSFLTQEESVYYYDNLIPINLPFEQKYLSIRDKKIPVPRLTCWIAEKENLVYNYSAIKNIPILFPEFLIPLKVKLENQVGSSFNSVLVNLYRDGRDSVYYHSDNEKELGKYPTIASLSLGASRKFLIKHLDRIEKYILDSGDLFIMFGKSQLETEHCIPKDPQCSNPRINLTFRQIFT